MVKKTRGCEMVRSGGDRKANETSDSIRVKPGGTSVPLNSTNDTAHAPTTDNQLVLPDKGKTKQRKAGNRNTRQANINVGGSKSVPGSTKRASIVDKRT